jgi:type VI secretion system protein ImpF
VAIQRFEPRLADVAVTLVEGREFDRTLRFRIDALLKVDPAPEPVTFDSLLQLHTKAFVVKAD